MRDENNDKGKVYRAVALVLLFVFLVSAALLLLKMWEKRQGSFVISDSEGTSVEYNGKKYELKEDIESFLVIGLDKYEDQTTVDSYNNDQQSDFLMLFVFDDVAKTCTAIHINRDSMAKINVLGVAGNTIDTVTKQIALSHTYGNGGNISCINTADAVSDLLLGVKVDHYISFTLDSVAILNDLVGGVEVTVLDDFTGIDDTLIKGETVTLHGDHALHYVRTRYGLEDSSNNARMERQQQYINALYAKTKECIENDDEFAIKASLEMSDYIISDRSVSQLQELSTKFTEYDFKGISSFEGETRRGEKFMEFYPDEDSVREIVMSLFYTPVE